MNVKDLMKSAGETDEEKQERLQKLKDAATSQFGIGSRLQKTAEEAMRPGLEITERLSELYQPPNFARFLTASPMPKVSEINEFQSASMLLSRLSERYEQWTEENQAEEIQLVLYALVDGLMIRVNDFTAESFHGIGINGTINNMPCLIVLHQSNFKLLCIAEPITAESPRRKIGFFTTE